MRVTVYKLEGDRIDIMVEASPGNGKSPVVLQHITKESLVGALLPVVEAQKGRRLAPRD